jgi:hypothetical protein
MPFWTLFFSHATLEIVHELFFYCCCFMDIVIYALQGVFKEGRAWDVRMGDGVVDLTFLGIMSG